VALLLHAELAGQAQSLSQSLLEAAIGLASAIRRARRAGTAGGVKRRRNAYKSVGQIQVAVQQPAAFVGVALAAWP